MAGLGGVGGDLDCWLEPFLAALGHKKRRLWAPLYLRGLLGPSERKSLQPMATSLGLSGHDQLQHFIASPAWDDAPLWRVLTEQADRLVGGPEAVLVIDDTALPKKGTLSPEFAVHRHTDAESFDPQGIRVRCGPHRHSEACVQVGIDAVASPLSDKA